MALMGDKSNAGTIVCINKKFNDRLPWGADSAEV
jgi:hypothetical protein